MSMILGSSSRRASGSRLSSDKRFRPPHMPSPYIIHAATGEFQFPRGNSESGNAFQASADSLWYFNANVDVVIYMPTVAGTISSTKGVLGGRHVRTIGGKMTATGGTSMFQCRNQVGSAFIEGMHLDGGSIETDAFVIRHDAAIATEMGAGADRHGGVTYQHCLVENLRGSSAGIHADVIQAQGHVDQILVEEFTGHGDYQCFFLPNQSTSDTRTLTVLRKVNVKYFAGGDPASTYNRGIWFYDGDSSARDATKPLSDWELDRFYYYDTTSGWGQRASWPQDNHVWGPTLASDPEGEYLTFPGALQIAGRIRAGDPPGGDFVTAATVGLNYVSPWPVP